jgi:hypothetical protein
MFNIISGFFIWLGLFGGYSSDLDAYMTELKGFGANIA